jgi:hypothetical protein
MRGLAEMQAYLAGGALFEAWDRARASAAQRNRSHASN